MNPIGASILAVLAFVVLLAPRQWAVLAMMAGVLYLTQAQAVDVLGFNLYAVRFLELAGCIRVMARREFSFLRLNRIDQGLLLLYSYTAIVYSLWAADGRSYVIGNAVDAFLCYFTFRGLIREMEDFRWFLRAFVLLLAPFVALILLEAMTRHNPFSFLGDTYDWVRGDRFRCVGSFRHPDLLGTLGASFLPLYIGLTFARRDRWFALIGIGLCLVIVWASNSGGPLGAAAFGLVGWAFWTVRTKMREVRWGIVGGIALTALVMKAPIWYLIARISDITGGSGWHRSYLIDMAFQHLDKWWLAGMPITDTRDWFPYILITTGGADITNQFLSFGLNAGLGAIALFILLLTRAFSGLGEALASVRSNCRKPSETEFLLWGFGVMLLVHIVNWFGITYFDQIHVVWFMQLATISGLSETRAEAGSKIETDDSGDWPGEEDLLESEVQYEKQLP
jgi:hypothetical protein